MTQHLLSPQDKFIRDPGFLTFKNVLCLLRARQLSATYPGCGGVGVILQEVALQCETLCVCVRQRQTEDPARRVQHGPGVLKASWCVAVDFSLIGHPQTDDLIPPHLEGGRRVFWVFLPYSSCVLK